MDSISAQLTFIEKISLDSEQGFQDSEDFKSAMNILAEMLTTEFVVLTNMFFDSNNLEYRLNHQIFSQFLPHQMLTATTTKLNLEQFSELMSSVSSDSGEAEIDSERFLKLVVSDVKHKEALNDAIGSEPIRVMPIYSHGLTVGALSYVSARTLPFSEEFPAVHNVLKSIMSHQQQIQQMDVELHTYQTVLDLMPQRVFWKNRQSVYLGCNQAFANDASLEGPSNIIGVTDYDIFPEQAELYRGDDANTMETREHLIASEEPQTHADGKTIWLRTSKRPVITKDDNVIGLVGTYDDITELKNIQLELSSAKDELEHRVSERTIELTESNQKLESVISELKNTQEHLVETEKMAALGGLVAGVAHEINTPIGVAVTGSSHLEKVATTLKKNAKEGKLSQSQFNNSCDQLTHSCELILDNLRRASELIRNFKMIAVDQTHDEQRTIDVKNYLHDIVNAMTPKTRKKNIRIYLAGDERIQLNTFPGAIAQIFTNLLDNAMEHAFETVEQGEIKIQFFTDKGQLHIEFKDNGQGLAKADINKVFDPFYTTKRGAGGSGLGLSIVYNLVTQRLKGAIVCESKASEGTSFKLTLPV